MLKLARSLRLWVKLRRSYLAADYELAANLADKYRREGIVDERFEALDATLDLLTDNPERALEKFSRLLDKILSDRPRRNSEYIELYCRYYLALLRGEEASRYRDLMLKARATNHIRRVLPVL